MSKINHGKIIVLSLIFGVAASIVGMGLTGAIIEPYTIEINEHLENSNRLDDPLSNTKIISLEREDIRNLSLLIPIFSVVYGLSFIPLFLFRKELRVKQSTITEKFDTTWLLGIGLFCFTIGFLFISTISDSINSHQEVTMNGKAISMSELKFDLEKYAFELNEYSKDVRSGVFVNSWYAAHSFAIGMLALAGLIICKFTKHTQYNIAFGGGVLIGLILLVLLMRFLTDA